MPHLAVLHGTSGRAPYLRALALFENLARFGHFHELNVFI